VPAENLIVGPIPEPLSWTPTPTTMVVRPTTPPGVDMTPPYQSPIVTTVGPVSCRLGPETPDNWEIRFNATLVGGRYWTFPNFFDGNTGAFVVGWYDVRRGHSPGQGFDSQLTSLSVRTPGGNDLMTVPINPPVPVHCGDSAP
jgi:hypothetical protein